MISDNGCFSKNKFIFVCVFSRQFYHDLLRSVNSISLIIIIIIIIIIMMFKQGALIT